MNINMKIKIKTHHSLRKQNELIHLINKNHHTLMLKSVYHSFTHYKKWSIVQIFAIKMQH